MQPIFDGFLCGMVCPGGGFTRGPQPQRPGWCLPLRLRLHLWHECVLAVASRAVFSFGGVLFNGFLVGFSSLWRGHGSRYCSHANEAISTSWKGLPTGIPVPLFSCVGKT